MAQTTGQTPGPSYSEYLRIPELLAQQECRSRPEVHDELQFIIVHQVYELWFKLVLHELDEVRRQLEEGSDTGLRTALRLCRRVTEIFKVLTAQIHVLETMRPAEFLAFRVLLNPASGFQSVQFREVECVLGLKDPRLVAPTAREARHDELRRRLDAPSVGDAFYGALSARGHGVAAPGTTRSPADAERTQRAFKRIYDDPDAHPLVYALCEALVEIDEHLALWRRHHIMMVHRQIGDKPGTGKGTMGDADGIRYLRTTTARRAFPDLWEVRTVLEG